MLFNSSYFIYFFPVVYIIYWILAPKNLNAQNIFLLIASYIFYGFSSLKFLSLLLLISFIDYSFGHLIFRKKKYKIYFLLLSLILNIGILFLFKYFNFFSVEFNFFLESIGVKYRFLELQFLLPIGISFYTFHGMSYVIDVYQKKLKPVDSFFEYALFVSFFPLLVAGPIERASHLLPQITKRRSFSYSQNVDGLKLILWGMFKKVIIADTIAKLVDACYLNHEDYNGTTLLFAIFAYSFQIYADFSAYSDIAIGISKMLGFELLSNFKYPYFAINIIEFWRKWHISLTSWFRDYVYFPIGGSRMSALLTTRNVIIVFLISGFWHGANWTFLIWGLLHAVAYLVVLFSKKSLFLNKLFEKINNSVSIVLTFIFVSFAWIFFRSQNLGQAYSLIKHLFLEFYLEPLNQMSFPFGKTSLFYIILLIIIDYSNKKNDRLIFNYSVVVRRSVYFFMFLWLLIHGFDIGTNFIYFSF